jgi:thioredoxin 1
MSTGPEIIGFPGFSPHDGGTRHIPFEEYPMHPVDPVIHTSDAAFERDVLKSEKPVLVDFWAEWCGPCRMIGPIVDEIARERQDSLRVVKVNVDDSPGIAQKFGVRSIPTLMIFSGGALVAQKIGALRKVELSALVDRAA